MSDATLRAQRRFAQYLDEIPGFWRPGSPSWCQIRAWAIDDGGAVLTIPIDHVHVSEILGDTDRIEKDLRILQIAAWSKQNRPEAVIVASEAWTFHVEPEAHARMIHKYGRTPNLMDPENREIMATEFGAKPRESLIVHAEIKGAKPEFRVYLNIDGRAKRQAQAGQFRSRFDGILYGTPAMDAGAAHDFAKGGG